MIKLYAALHGKRGQVNKAGKDALNSKPGIAWSDRVRSTDKPMHAKLGLHMPAMYLFSQLCRPAPIVKHVGPTKTFKALMWRDDTPSLFDLCQAQPSLPHQVKHKPVGSLPEWKPTERKPNALKREADAAVEAWRAQRQLEHLEALTQWRR